MKTISEVCIVDTSLIDNILILAKSREGLLKLFAEEEIRYCYEKKKWNIYLAARFAAKEAVYKILGARAEIRWNTIIIKHHSSGAPYINLNGSAAVLARELQVIEWHLSLTHTDQYAAAFVAAEAQEGGNSPFT